MSASPPPEWCRLEAWLDRLYGRLSYRITQVLTEHGCFGKYLLKVGSEATAECLQCSVELDSAQHTLIECPAFSRERLALRLVVREDHSLPALVAAMVDGRRS